MLAGVRPTATKLLDDKFFTKKKHADAECIAKNLIAKLPKTYLVSPFSILRW
jgi:hypothetical protein